MQERRWEFQGLGFLEAGGSWAGEFEPRRLFRFQRPEFMPTAGLFLSFPFFFSLLCARTQAKSMGGLVPFGGACDRKDNFPHSWSLLARWNSIPCRTGGLCSPPPPAASRRGCEMPSPLWIQGRQKVFLAAEISTMRNNWRWKSQFT